MSGERAKPLDVVLCVPYDYPILPREDPGERRCCAICKRDVRVSGRYLEMVLVCMDCVHKRRLQELVNDPGVRENEERSR